MSETKKRTGVVGTARTCVLVVVRVVLLALCASGCAEGPLFFDGDQLCIDCVCGDGICNGDESAATCTADCAASCGDGVCSGSEGTATCPVDCGSPCSDFDNNGVCDDSDADILSWEVDAPAQSYVLGGHFTPADRLILTELDAFGGPDIVDYPMCIYPEETGQAIEDPEAVREHMEVVVNTWLPYLYNRWGFGINSVRFALKATTEADCADSYEGVRPFSVTSYDGGAFGGMAKRIRVRFPGRTVNAFANGTAHRQSILHEVGHVLGLMHTMEQSPNSVMDYDDMHNIIGITGDDVVGMTHAWRYLSGQIERGECEFGYAGGPTCIPADIGLATIQLRNVGTLTCVEEDGTGDGASLVTAACNGNEHQIFSVIRASNGWRLRANGAQACVEAPDAPDSGAFSLAGCDSSRIEQDFTLLQNEDETFMIRSEHSGMMLQLDGGNLEQAVPTGGLSQVFRLDAPGTPCTEAECPGNGGANPDDQPATDDATGSGGCTAGADASQRWSCLWLLLGLLLMRARIRSRSHDLSHCRGAARVAAAFESSRCEREFDPRCP